MVGGLLHCLSPFSCLLALVVRWLVVHNRAPQVTGKYCRQVDVPDAYCIHEHRSYSLNFVSRIACSDRCDIELEFWVLFGELDELGDVDFNVRETKGLVRAAFSRNGVRVPLKTLTLTTYSSMMCGSILGSSCSVYA